MTSRQAEIILKALEAQAKGHRIIISVARGYGKQHAVNEFKKKSK